MIMRLASALAIILAALGPDPAHAQNAGDPFYRGKVLTLSVGSAPGGGYDVYGRLVGRYLGRHIPGSPSINVQNMPGAGSNRAANYISTQAPKDGTAIGIVQAGALLGPLLSDQPFQHDPSKLLMLGSANRSVYLCLVRADAPVKTFQETFDKEVIIGTSTEGATLREMPVLLVDLLGVKLRLVGGYAGSREIILAMDRNEVQGMCGMDWSSLVTQRRDWLDTGFVRPIAQEDLAGHPELNKLGVPLTTSFAKDATDRQALELMYSGNMFGRPFILPPGAPAERLETLRRAFSAAMADENLREEAARMQLDIESVPGAELQAVLAKLYATPPSVVARLKQALVFKPAQK